MVCKKWLQWVSRAVTTVLHWALWTHFIHWSWMIHDMLNSYIFIQENAFENDVYEMAAIFSQPQCVSWNGRSSVQIMACHLLSTKPLPQSMLSYDHLDHLRTNFSEISTKIQTLSNMKIHFNLPFTKWWPFSLRLYVLYMWDQHNKGLCCTIR